MLNRKYLEENYSRYDAVVLSAVWSQLEEEALFDEVEDLVVRLTKNGDTKVIIMAQPQQFDRASVYRAVYKNGHLMTDASDALARTVNQRLADISSTNSDVFFIDRRPMFETGRNPQDALSSDMVPYSWDGDHISIYGSTEAGRNFIRSDQLQPLQAFLGR